MRKSFPCNYALHKQSFYLASLIPCIYLFSTAYNCTQFHTLFTRRAHPLPLHISHNLKNKHTQTLKLKKMWHISGIHSTIPAFKESLVVLQYTLLNVYCDFHGAGIIMVAG